MLEGETQPSFYEGLVMDLPQTSIRNFLLAAISVADYALLQPHLIRITLPLRLQLERADTLIERIYFPEDGIASIVAADQDGNRCEVGAFGREGMSGTAAVLGVDRSPHQVYMQVAGTFGLRIATSDLRHAIAQSITLRALLLRYVQSTLIQFASSTVAASIKTIEQRIARELLMYHDRLDGGDVPLSHEFFATILGCRRASVTVAVQSLERKQLIKTGRCHIFVHDRTGLKHLAGSGYGSAEAAYPQLINNDAPCDSREPQASTSLKGISISTDRQ